AVATVGVFASEDFGATWQQSDAPPHAYRSIAGSADGAKLILAAINTQEELGGVYTSTDFGASWVQTGLSQGDWVAVASASDGNTLVAAVRTGRIYTWHADPAPPRLSISRLQGQVLLSWSAPSSFVLQQSAEPTSTNW